MRSIISVVFIVSTYLVISHHAWSQEMQTTEPSPLTESEKNTKQNIEKNTDDNSQSTGVPSANKSSEINPPVDALEQHQADLAHYLATEQLFPLLVGTQKYTLTVATHETPQNKGTIVLLPDGMQILTNPHAINFLRTALPKFGWTTITVTPPKLPDNYPSLAVEESGRLTENTEVLSSYRSHLTALIEQLFTKAKEFPGVLVLLAQGSHAAMIPEMFNTEAVEAPAAFIMLSSYMLTAQATEQAARHLAHSNVPTLDLYLKRDNHLVAPAAKLRRKLTIQELTPGFRQKQLHNIITGYYPDSVSSEIKGWLYSLGW